MDFLDSLRAQKREGEREWAKKQAEESQRQTEEAARLKAKEEALRSAEAQKDRKKAEEVYASLPPLVRQAAERGLDAAILVDSFVDERPPDDKPSRAIVLNRRTYYLKGWQIPFYEMCQESGVPLKVVSERVNVGLKGILHRTFYVLAVDLHRL